LVRRVRRESVIVSIIYLKYMLESPTYRCGSYCARCLKQEARR
jgi:hypothetical protein